MANNKLTDESLMPFGKNVVYLHHGKMEKNK